MRNKRCAIGGDSDREGCDADGAVVTVSRSRTLGKALLPWAAAAAMLLGGGGLAVEAQTVEPPDKCSVSGTEVTCTGELSNGVAVEDLDEDIATYTKLVVKDLTNNVTLADGARNKGVYFNSLSDIDITVDTGDFGIITLDSCEDCVGIAAYSEDSAVTVRLKGTITTSGRSSEGIDVGSVEGNDIGDGGDVTVEMEGNILTEGERSIGIYAKSETKIVTVEVTGNIETKGTDSHGIAVTSDGGNLDIKLNGGKITSDQANGIDFYKGNNNKLTIRNAVTISGGVYDVLGGIKNETIDNYGTLTTSGTINLGEGNNTFNNRAGATFNSGDSVILRHDGDMSGTADVFTNWGNLSPGGAGVVQETTIIGNFVNMQEGMFTVTIDPETGTHDKLIVQGTAPLEGGMVKITGLTDTDAGPYTILEADGGVTGRFDDIIDTLFMDYDLSYGAKYVDFSFKFKGDEFRDFAGTPNQLAVANALDSLLSPNKNTELVQAVLALTTTAGAQAAYDNLSGEVHASLKGALMDTAQRPVAAVHRRLTARGSQPNARTSTAVVGDLSSRADGESGFWMTSYGAWGETKATANTAQMDTELGGILFGMDRALDKRWRLGVLGGYGQTSVGQGARASSGSAETWSVGLYGGGEVGASRLRFGALYNGHSVTAHRTARVPGILGFSDRLSARYDARSWQFFAEAGHQLQAGNVLLEPFAGVSHIRLGTDGFSETGGTNAALTASSDTNSRTLTTLGVRSAMEVQDMVQARGLVGWRHAFGDTDPSASTGTLANSATGTILGAPTAEDAVVTEFGLEAGLSAHAVIGVAYQGQYGDGVTVHGINAGLKVTF